MTANQIKTLFTILLAILATVSFAVGVNAWVGAGVFFYYFFTIWCFWGIMELHNDQA
jgi:hypothetical protein